MKVQFVYAPLYNENQYGYVEKHPSPPLGIMYLASYFKKFFKYHSEIVMSDGVISGYKKTLKNIIDFEPDIIVMSFLTVNAPGAYKLINEAKSVLRDVFVVSGGIHASALPGDVLKNSKTDIVILGEGEKVLLDVVSALHEKTSFCDVKGIAFLENGVIKKTNSAEVVNKLEDIPAPDYDMISLKNYKGWYFQKQHPEIMILSSRGCKFGCLFCVNGSKCDFRFREVDDVINEIKNLHYNFGIREFFDQGSEFNHDLEWAEKFCRAMIDQKLTHISWKVQMRADLINNELAKDMSRAGCWAVLLGVESANQKTLDGIGKGIKMDDVRNFCNILKGADLKVLAMFMIFNFWEKEGKLEYEGVDESLNTLEYAKGLFKDGLCDFVSWAPSMPYPGTKLYDIACKHNLIENKKWEYWNNVWNFVVKLPGVSQKDYDVVKKMGAKLQIKCTLKNLRYINVNSRDVFIKRGIRSILKWKP